MGCCISAPEANSVGGAPPTSPPPVLEEETVKEVLLETPAAVIPEADDEGLMPPEWKVGVEPPQGKACDDEIVSEVSEMCSYSESYSNATAGRDGEEDGVVDQRPPARKRRGPTGGGRGRGRGRSGERVTGGGRRAAPSPERRGHAAPVRPARGRQSAGQQRNATEEKLGRRSRSPVRRGEDVARRNASGEKRDSANDVVPGDEAETLENPVVSLECFIFL